jgi:endonuclease YncB( thermonuclease family)
MKSKPIAAVVLSLGIGFAGCYALRNSEVDYNPEQTVETYSVKRFVDGDTVHINEGIEVLLYKIRLLGIDAPEGDREATKALEDLIANRPIILKKDPSRDLGKYGRPLRYIFVGDTNINVEMVRLGCAKAFMHKGLMYEKEILEAEREAKEKRLGIWNLP